MAAISIIIPVYNVEPYVRRCLESVMSQGDAGASLECIIVDDCGQDGSMSIVRQIIEDYEGPIRFTIATHEHNRGLSAARNTGLAKASGDYVMFIDSDDYLTDGSMQYFIDMLGQHPGADMVMGNVRNCKDGSLLISGIEEPRLLDDPNVFFPDMLHHRIYLYAWNKLIRREVLTENGILFEEGILYEDQLWSYQLFKCLSSVLLLPKVTYVYENNASSIVNTTFTPEKASKALWSYALSCNKMLDSPPSVERYKRSPVVDYLLFMANSMTNGLYLHLSQPIDKEIWYEFRTARKRLLLRSMRYCRLTVATFMLLLFPPLSYLQKWRFFRHHYYDIELAVNIMAHITDFLHPHPMKASKEQI
ncbi:MAG: glycosyltransferase family 2 protein [Prevotella sp.]|nr:glycosyltransferase family 2 protein [Prevotella sp.]